MKKLLAIYHISCEKLGIFKSVFERAGYSIKYADASKADLSWDKVKNYDAFVILGGPMGVYEDKKYPFIKIEKLLVRNITKTKKPLLGICFGSQLIASALGGRVFKGKKKEIGWYKVDFTGPRPLATGHKSLSAFQWHGDTFTLPKGAKKLASSILFKNQGFLFGKNILALQFHLEVTEKMVKEWIKEYSEELKKEGLDPKKILSDTKKNIRSLNAFGTDLIKSWLSAVAARVIASGAKLPNKAVAAKERSD